MRDLAAVVDQVLALVAEPRREAVRHATTHVLRPFHYPSPEAMADRWREFSSALQLADMDGLILDAERVAIQALLRGEG